MSQCVESVDDRRPITGMPEVIESDVGVFKRVVEDGDRLVDGIGKPKHHAQWVKDVRLRFSRRVSDTFVQRCGKRYRVLDSRFIHSHNGTLRRQNERVRVSR